MLAGAGNSNATGQRAPLFMPDHYAKMLIGVLLVLVTGATAMAWLGTEIAARDLFGGLLAAAVAAYVLHLWFDGSRRDS